MTTQFEDDDIDALFGVKPTQKARDGLFIMRPCVMCRMNQEWPVSTPHRICATCLSDPLRIDTALLATQRDIEQRMNAIYDAWDAALRAVDPATRRRWELFAAMRDQFLAGTLSEAKVAQFQARTNEILHDEADPLRGLVLADRRRLANGTALAPEVRRLNVMLEQWEIAQETTP